MDFNVIYKPYRLFCLVFVHDIGFIVLLKFNTEFYNYANSIKCFTYVSYFWKSLRDALYFKFLLVHVDGKIFHKEIQHDVMLSLFFSFLGNSSTNSNMNEVVDVLIKEGHVEDVTEDCNEHAHTILNVVPVDEFRDSAAINSSLIRY